jgi:hypothetical protein
LSWDIAEKELLRSLTEIDALPEPPEADAPAAGLEFAAAGAELLLELLELLQPAATSTAANAAAAVRPARADTEYNGVPRSFTHSDIPGTACARPDPSNPVTTGRAISGNARSVRRNVVVNTFVKRLKKR